MFWYDFLSRWQKVRSVDLLDWAYPLAQEQPCTVTPCLGPIYKTVASLAFDLSEQTQGGAIQLPTPRLASLLSTSRPTISNVLKLLERCGVIQCVDPTYRFTRGADGKTKARDFRFTGQGVNRGKAA